jgi:hypothetical protein
MPVGALWLLHSGDGKDFPQLATQHAHPLTEGGGNMSRSVATAATFSLALMKLGR